MVHSDVRANPSVQLEDGVNMEMEVDDKITRPWVNPEVTASVFSLFSFQWVTPMLTLGNKRPLNSEDIYPLYPLLQSERLTALFEQQWKRESEKKKKPRLITTLIKRHAFTLTWAALRMSTPWVVSRVTAYFVEDTALSYDTAILYAVLLFQFHFIYVIGRSWMFYSVMKLGSAIRISVSCLIYRKACRITQSEIGRTSVGHIINLMTNDAQRLDEYIVPAYVLLNIHVVLITSFLLMYKEIGIYGTLAGFTAMCAFVPLQVLMGKIMMKLRFITAPLTDERVKVISEIIASMKIIKMYGWELMFKDFVKKIRDKEMHYIGYFTLLKSYNNCMIYISPVIATFCVVVTKRYCDEEVTKDMIYFFLSTSALLRVYLNIFLGHSFAYVPQVIHSLGRIQDFLDCKEIDHIENIAAIEGLSNDVIRNKNFTHEVRWQSEIPEAIAVNNGAVNSDFANGITGDNGDEVVIPIGPEIPIEMSGVIAEWGEEMFGLRNINLTVRKGELVAVVGPVGCGKTSLLMTLIQELTVRSGELAVRCDIDFAAQSPWIFNGTVEENILFNRDLDKDRLDGVIKSCYLAKDIEQLPHGLNTLVGERGVQLSGGQRARVSLARAVYGQNPLILMDDPFSAVDSKCAKHLFNKLIKQALADKTRIVVTHSTNFLPLCDRIIVMDKGEITHDGPWTKISHLNLGALVEKKRTTSNLSRGSRKMSEDEGDESGDESKAETPVTKPFEEERKTGSLDKRLYFKYMSLGLGPLMLPILVSLLVAPQIIATFTEQFLLTNIAIKKDVTTVYKIGSISMDSFTVYTLLGALAIVLYFLKANFFILIVNCSAKMLHNMAMYAVLRSPMRYFDTNPIGILLNRFSKDTYYMDERFPDVFLDFIGLLVLYGTTVVIIAMANYYFIIALLPIMAGMLYVIKFYLKSSIEIRRVEAMNRSPVLSHIAATLAGLTTIRASRQVAVYEAAHYKKRDEHTKCMMLFHAASRWLNFRLDMLALCVAVGATFCCIILKDVIGASLAGLAIVYVNNIIGGFQWCVRQSTETENLMTAIERVHSFTKLPSEAPLKTISEVKKERKEKAHENGMSIKGKEGIVEFRNVYMRYAPELPYALHNLSFITKSAEKIGIVGRTGAGKSTILQSLFRICEPEGEVLIDGVNSAELGLHTLRRSISVIPQESLLFSATLKVNMDPFEEFTDEQLWSCLEQVQLKGYVSKQSDKLDMSIQEGGSNLSSGQRQLLCLARALLRSNKILVIDEATANVDQKTDELIQETLRKRFVDCTVLTIAHRINTIIDSDRIMVMDAGELVEFDSPKALLENTSSIFYMLVQETGFPEKLRAAAIKSYNNKDNCSRDLFP